MAESTFKDKVMDDLEFLSKSPKVPEQQRLMAQALFDKLPEIPEEDAMRFVWANFVGNGNVKGGQFRTLLTFLPEEGSELRKFVLGEKKPSYSEPKGDKLAEMFSSVGGKEVFDEASDKFYGRQSSDADRAKVRAIAKANGMTEQELWDAMQNESQRMAREKIYYGKDLGGWFDSPESFKNHLFARIAGIVLRRSAKKVKTGEDVSPTDLGLDIGENALFIGNPVGVGLKSGIRALGRFAPSIAARQGVVNTASHAVNSFATPALMELAEKGVRNAEGTDYDMSASNVIAGGLANLFAGRIIGGRANKFVGDGSIGTTKNGIGRFVSELKSRRAEMAENPTFKEWSKGVEQGIKKRAKVADASVGKDASMSMSPKQARELSGIVPINTGDPRLDKMATEIAKLVGKNNYSLDRATEVYFKNFAKSKKGGAKAASDLFDVAKESGLVTLGDGGKVVPNANLYKAIASSSWGDVFTKEFKKATKPKKESFIKKFLTQDIPVERPYYGHYATNKLRQVPEAQKMLQIDEDKEREEALMREAERKAMQKYIFGME